MTRRARVAIATSVLAVLFSPSVSAQPSTTEAALAIRLFEDAEKLMATGNVAAACSRYAESQRIDPQLGTLLHLADCNEQVGKLASAWAGYKAAAEIAARRNAEGGKETRERVARARAEALEPKLSTVVIRVAEANLTGLEVRRDGELLDRAVWGAAMPVDPGRYTFAVQAPGKKLWTKTVDVPPGAAKVDVAVPALEDDRPSAAGMTGKVGHATGADPSVTDRSGRGGVQRTAGYVLTGLGVVGLGVGAYFGLTFLSQNSEIETKCPEDPCSLTADQEVALRGMEDEARANLMRFNVLMVVGGAATLGGIALVLTAPSSPAPGTAVKLVPWGGPTAAGASLAGSW